MTVTAKDAYGNTATGYPAPSTSPPPTAQRCSRPTTPSPAATQASTRFSAPRSKTAGSRTVTATDTVTGSITGTSAAITVNPAAAATLDAVAAHPPRSPPAAAASVTVTAKDAFGNTATGYTGTVHFTTTDGAAGLPSELHLRRRRRRRPHLHATPTRCKTAGSQTITATDTVTGTITGTSAGITVNPAAAATLVLTRHTRPRSPPATTGSVTVTAKDAFGNTATGYTGTVHFTTTDGAAVLPANYTFTGGDTGVHTFTNAYTLKTAGSQTLTATDTVTGTITGTSAGDHRQPGRRGDASTVTGTPASVDRRRAPTNVTVTAKDAFGNIATGYTGTVHFTTTDGAAALPADYTFTGGDAGVHIFQRSP